MENDVFNAADVLETFMNNEEAVLPLLSRFIERTKNQLEGLKDLEKAGDWESAHREAHMIKGAALTMGGKELGNAAARLELAYKNIDMKEMEAALPLVKKAYDSFKKEAEEFLHSKS